MAGRMMIALLGAALVLLVYQWSSELFGWRGGFISMLLCAFCPALLAHGALITADMAIAFFFTFGAWAFWRLGSRFPWGAWWFTLALTGLIAFKMSSAIRTAGGGRAPGHPFDFPKTRCPSFPPGETFVH